MKELTYGMLLITFIIASACFGETVNVLKFTDDELNQIRVTKEGDYMIFTVPNKDWKINLNP